MAELLDGKIGDQTSIKILWRAWLTAAQGVVACRTADLDKSCGEWTLTHAATGRVVGWFDDPEQCQAAAAKLTDIDWAALEYNATGPVCITWGAPKQMTWEWFDFYTEEAYGVLSADWAQAGKAAPSGFDLAALQADIGGLEG